MRKGKAPLLDAENMRFKIGVHKTDEKSPYAATKPIHPAKNTAGASNKSIRAGEGLKGNVVQKGALTDER